MMRAIGAISGTSMDGVDVTFVETDGVAVQCGPGATYPYPPELRTQLLAIAATADTLPSAALHAPEQAVTAVHVAAIRRFMDQHDLAARDVDVVGLHGQTVLHQPERRRTVQLGSGAVAAASLGIDTVDSFRLADVAAGGQGAPFVPLYHAALAGSLDKPLAVLNLGGVGNVTWLGADDILAFDTGPASALLDDFVLDRLGVPFDQDGATAAAGKVDRDIVDAFLTHPFFARRPPKSLDRNGFPALVAAVQTLSTPDGAATLAACTVASVVAAGAHMPSPPQRWLVAGGGRRNTHFMRELAVALGVPVAPVESVGWDGDFLEAQAFAFLAVRSVRGLPLSLPGTTGVPVAMLGGHIHSAAGR